MAIRHRSRRPASPAYRNAGSRRPVNASSSITSGVRSRQSNQSIMASMRDLSPEQRAFARQLQSNIRRQSAIMGATNTSNIAAIPAFMELLPLFVQKLLITDVFGSVAMKSRQQIIPYFKFIAENTKGETPAGTILSSPMVNRQGMDPNFTGRIIKNEIMATEGAVSEGTLMYTPILPGSVTVQTNISGVTTPYVDDGAGNIIDGEGAQIGVINYSNGAVTFLNDPFNLTAGDSIKATYQYDNETVGPNEAGQYGAKMAKGYLATDEINLVAEAHEIACYWSIYSAFASQQEYGSNIQDIAKDAAFSELTAEINTAGFAALEKAASYNPQFNWDAAPVLSGSVVPSDYLNMFKLKLEKAAASIYSATNLSHPNRLIVGTDAAAYISMINSFRADNTEDTVGPYKLGTLDKFEVYVDPKYDPTKWVMCCKSNDIRRNSALFGEYMPFTNTDAIGLANASVQQGYATMYAMEIVNPATIVSGKILGTM